MATFRGQEFPGIVVSRKNYKERDMLVRIYTGKFGFKTFFVRGARRKGFKNSAAILPFTYGTYVGDISEEGLSFITNVTGTKQYQRPAQDIMSNAYAAYILELADVAFRDDDQLAIQWFPLIKKVLDKIDDGLDPAVMANIIEVKLLRCFGVAPELQRCVICQRNDLPCDFSESYGGLLCQRHWHLDPNRMHLNARTVYFLSLFDRIDINQIRSIKVKEITKVSLRKTLDQIYYDMVGVYVRAKRFIDRLNRTHLKPLKPRKK